MSILEYQKLYLDAPDLQMPQTSWSAGIDLAAYGSYFIAKGETCVVNTGIAVAIPFGFVGLLFPRSGLRFNHGVNTFGTGVIDADYRGEIKIKLIAAEGSYFIEHGDRVAQLVIVPIYQINNIVQVDKLQTTDRGDSGFGSTGTGLQEMLVHDLVHRSHPGSYSEGLYKYKIFDTDEKEIE